MSQIDFQKLVLERSHEVPVVVDFWAEWCGPCRVLGPVIEELADQAAGSWELVKLNTESQPEISQQYNIMSIPAVKMFHKGEVVAEFVGALPRHSISTWLQEHLPDGRKEELNSLRSALATPEANTPNLLEQLKTFCQSNPDMIDARLFLAESLLPDSPEESLALLAGIKVGNTFFAQAEDLRNIVALLQFQPDSNSPASPLLSEAKEALKVQELEKTIQQVIEAVILDKGFKNDLPRKVAIALFNQWGPQDELTRRYRKRFDMALY